MKRWQTLLLILAFLVGLSLLIYPPLSNYWNTLRQSRIVAEYMQDVSNLTNERKETLFAEAAEYNRALALTPPHYVLTPEEQTRYEQTLDVSGTGIMGYLEIPAIDVSLPIYHGTEEVVLEFAVGHLTGTSLPVGGESTHTVLTGHTGLPSARLLTDLEDISEGEIFYIQVMDETLTYEVDQIRVVLPEVTQDLEITPGEDYCTILTCTPYGVNSHRLLVRGHRIETARNTVMRFSADAIQLDPLIVMPFLAAPLLLILFLLVMLRPSEAQRKRRRDEQRRRLGLPID